jgi:phosphoribosylamine--glycine ligase
MIWGSGAREDALSRVLRNSGHKNVWAVPGNPGMPHRMTHDDPAFIAEHMRADLVVFGPEDPLTKGEADKLRAMRIPVFGPGEDGARLEGSKQFMKNVVTVARVPTAVYRTFDPTQLAKAQRFAMDLIGSCGFCVIKTDYLAAGKGVLVTDDAEEAKLDIAHKLKKGSIIIEEYLTGPEVSVFAICDGTNSICLPAAQDFKRAYDGDAGPNTGGMGAWSPLPFLEDGFEETINRDFIQPTLAELRQRGIDYRGCLYAGLMLTPRGPKLLEYNIRFGDPDSQVVLMRLDPEYDFAGLLLAAAKGDLTTVPAPTFMDQTAVLVVAAAEGYPISPRTGDIIEGLEEAHRLPQVEILTAGVAKEADDNLITSGGRVLNVMGFGPDAYMARKQAYDALQLISWQGMFYRTDIALRLTP